MAQDLRRIGLGIYTNHLKLFCLYINIMDTTVYDPEIEGNKKNQSQLNEMEERENNASAVAADNSAMDELEAQAQANNETLAEVFTNTADTQNALQYALSQLPTFSQMRRNLTTIIGVIGMINETSPRPISTPSFISSRGQISYRERFIHLLGDILGTFSPNTQLTSGRVNLIENQDQALAELAEALAPIIVEGVRSGRVTPASSRASSIPSSPIHSRTAQNSGTGTARNSGASTPFNLQQLSNSFVPFDTGTAQNSGMSTPMNPYGPSLHAISRHAFAAFPFAKNSTVRVKGTDQVGHVLSVNGNQITVTLKGQQTDPYGRMSRATYTSDQLEYAGGKRRKTKKTKKTRKTRKTKKTRKMGSKRKSRKY
jgi:hypothetical protein